MNEYSPSAYAAPCGFDYPSPTDRQEWLPHLERLHDQLLKDLTARLGRNDAQDVLQEFYLRVLRYRPRTESDAGVRSFINRILRSVVADHFRRLAAQRKVTRALAMIWENPVIDDPNDAADSDWLPRFIGQLPRQYATLIDRVDINEEPRSVVAATLGITCNNLAVRLLRARSALRTRLLAFRVCCPVHGFADCCCPKSPTRNEPRHDRARAALDAGNPAAKQGASSCNSP